MRVSGTALRELRMKNGFSQEELSGRAGVSARTIQRIENDEVNPNGDSLRRIAAALNVVVEDLMTKSPSTSRRDDNVITLSMLTYLIHPLLGIIIVLIVRGILLNSESKSRSFMNETLNFTLQMALLDFIAFLISVIYIAVKSDSVEELSFAIIRQVPMVLIVHLLIRAVLVFMVVLNVVRIRKKQSVQLPVLFKFVK